MSFILLSRAQSGRVLAASAAIALAASATFGGTSTGGFASHVVSFSQGTGLPPKYFNNPVAALGAPDSIDAAGTVYPNVMDPFNPAYGKNQVVVLGKGGQITLQLYRAITVANTAQIGVISNVGLVDVNYPNEKAAATAGIFGGGVADVRVSSDNKTWKDLGNITFNLPASYWARLNAPYETAPSKTDLPANLGKPFVGKLSNFNGENYAAALKTLNGSVGGTWLNVFNTHLKTVDYIQFRNPLPTPWVPSHPLEFTLDSVSESSVSSPAVGGPHSAAVPLPAAAPAALLMLAFGGAVQWFRRRLAR